MPTLTAPTAEQILHTLRRHLLAATTDGRDAARQALAAFDALDAHLASGQPLPERWAAANRAETAAPADLLSLLTPASETAPQPPRPAGGAAARPALTEHAPSTLPTAAWQVGAQHPSTSAQAARKAALSAGRTNHRVFWLLHDAGSRGMTDEELETASRQRHQSISATRRSLVLSGYVSDSGTRRPTSSGNDATVWTLTLLARQRIARGLETRPVD